MLNRDFNSLTVNGPLLLGAEYKNVFGGTPLTIDATTGKYKRAINTDKVVGLSFNNYNLYANEVDGGDFMVNSKMVSVVKIAQVTLTKDVFKVGDDLQEFYPFDKTKVYAYKTKLYVNSSGIITSDDAVAQEDDKNFVGTVVVPYDANSNDSMTIEVNL